VNYSTKLKGNDFDIGILMNLLSPIKKDINPYPIYKITNEKENVNYTKPDVLVVGDSYWWCVVGDDLPKKFFREDEYWFYNRDIVFQNNQQKDKVKEVNLASSLAQRDVVLLMATEATFYMFPYGFVDNAYKLYCADNSKRLNEIKNDIEQNQQWYIRVKAKGILNNNTPDKQLKLEAESVLSDELFKPKASLESVIENIRNTPIWMKDIEAKAKENNIPVEEQLKKDAQWQVDNNAKAAESKSQSPLESIIIHIMNDAYRMADIRAKAKQHNLSEGEQIKQDAQWLLENDKDTYKEEANTTEDQPSEETLESTMAYIKSDAKWMTDIKRKAKENKISMEEQLKKDAQWQLDNKKDEHKEEAKTERARPSETLESVIAYIKSDAKWMADIKAKAKENKISVEEQIKKDAEWKLSEDKK
jgi:hypothetical protein